MGEVGIINCGYLTGETSSESLMSVILCCRHGVLFFTYDMGKLLLSGAAQSSTHHRMSNHGHLVSYYRMLWIRYRINPTHPPSHDN